jgi:hypothetical protein
MAALGVTLLLASYARPEFFVGFFLSAVVGLAGVVWVSFRRPSDVRYLTLPMLAVILPTASLLWLIGNPLSGNRSFVAFGQHYAVNLDKAKKLDRNPWMHWESIVREDFGDAKTPAEAFKTNPRAAAWHIAANAKSLPREFLHVGIPHLGLGINGDRVLKWGMILAAALGLVGLVYRLWSRAQAPSDRRALWVGMLMFGLLSVPVIASALLVFPRLHYLMPVMFFSFVLVAVGLSHIPRGQPFWRPSESWAGLAIVGALLLAVTPNRTHGWALQTIFGKPTTAAAPELCIKQTSEALRTFDFRSPPVVLDFLAMTHSVFAGLPINWVDVTQKVGGFTEFIRQKDVTVVILDPYLCADPMYRNDPEFAAFVTGKHVGDFQLFAVPGVPVQIAVRQDVLLAAPPHLQRPDTPLALAP